MEQQLLQIETVPISFEYVESKKPVSLSQSVAKLEISREQQKPADIKSEPVKIRVDSFVKTHSKDAVTSEKLAYTATAGYDNKGNIRLNVNLQDADTSAVRFNQVGRSVEGMAAQIDTSPVIGMSYTNQTVENEDFRNYFPLGNSNISISFDLSGLRDIEDANFTPPDLELEVTENAHVVITYVGGPIYVPKSADPNYEPPAQTGFAAEA